MWGIILALISGALMSIQGVFNTEVTKQTSLWVSTGFVQLTAFFVCVIAWLCTGRENVALLTEVRPWYLLTGGILGAFITITVVQSMGSLGPAQAVIIIVTSQVAVAYLIELFGLFGSSQASFSWRKRECPFGRRSRLSGRPSPIPTTRSWRRPWRSGA